MAQTKPKNQPRQRKIPQRRCVGCAESFDKRSLIRVVRSPDGGISIDFTGKKSGRGAYICKSGQCLKKARKTGALSRALECEISPEIYDALEREISLGEPKEDE